MSSVIQTFGTLLVVYKSHGKARECYILSSFEISKVRVVETFDRKFMEFKGLNGTVVRITSRYNSLYKYDADVQECLQNCNGSKYIFNGGFVVELFLHLKDFLQFEFEFVPDVGPYNFSQADSRAVDIFVASYSLYYNRAKLASPTFVIGNSKIVAVINHEHEGNFQDIFTLPFSRRLWIGVALLILYFVIIILAISRLYKYSIHDSLFAMAAVILQKECSEVYTSFRPVFIVISLTTIVVLTCYSGTIFSMKAVHRFVLRSVKDVIVRSNYKVLIELGDPRSAIPTMLQALIHIPLIARLLERFLAANSYAYTTFENAVEEVRRSSTMYIIDEATAMSSIEKQIGQLPCSWGVFPVFNLKYPWAMFMRRNSSLKPWINYGLLRLDESGLRKRLQRKWIPHASKCQSNSHPFSAVGFSQVYSGLSIYFAGLCLSVLILSMMELRFFKRLKC